MPPPLSIISLALQPPSLHSLPTHSKARRSHRGSPALSMLSLSQSPSVSATTSSSLYTHSSPQGVAKANVSGHNNRPLSTTAPASTRLSLSSTAATITATATTTTPATQLLQQSSPSASPQTRAPPACAAETLACIDTGRNPRRGGSQQHCAQEDNMSTGDSSARIAIVNADISFPSELVSVSALSCSLPSPGHRLALARSPSSSSPSSSFSTLPSPPRHRSSSAHLNSSQFQSAPRLEAPLAGPIFQSAQPSQNNVLWRAYSRVKQTLAETQTAAGNPLETMTEYWYSFGAPRPQDLQQSNDNINISNNNKHILTNSNDSATAYLSIDMTTVTAESSAVKATAVNPPRRVKFFVCDDESSDSDSDNDDFNCGNKGLEEIDRVPSCSSGHLNHRGVVGRPSPRRNAHYNLQSMEEHDDGDCEDFDDTGSIISVSFSGEEKEEGERKDYFGKNVVMTNSSSSSLSAKLSLESRQRQASAPIATTASTPMRGNGMQRRQSLLSDLLIAEKQRHTQLALDQDRNQEQERYLNSAANSDGESTIAEMAIPIPHHHHHNHSQQHHYRQYPSPAMQRNTSAAASHNNRSNNEIDLEEASSGLLSSPRLVRTKRVFKNLADLAHIAPAVPVPTSIPASSAVSPAEEKLHSPFLTSITTINTTTVHSTPAFPTFSTSPSSPASSTLSTLSTATSCTPSASPVLSTTGWTRSQVQVQIQSLVTQSTTTAQRALLTASATLTDVLFRAAR